MPASLSGPRHPAVSANPLFRQKAQHGGVIVSYEGYRGYTAAPHAHADLQVTIPVRGRMRVQIGESSWLIGPEQVIVLPPDQPHAVTHLDGHLEFVCMTAPHDWLASIRQELGGTTGRDEPQVLAACVYIRPLVHQLAGEIRSPGPASDRLQALCLEQIRMLLARQQIRGLNPGRLQDPRIGWAVDQILTAYGQDWPVEKLAAGALMSPRQFERLFKAEIGVSPHRYLMQVRLAVAYEQLQHAELSVTNLAAALGFSHASHFVRAFRQAYGVTPGAVQRQASATVSGT